MLSSAEHSQSRASFFTLDMFSKYLLKYLSRFFESILYSDALSLHLSDTSRLDNIKTSKFTYYIMVLIKNTKNTMLTNIFL